jgi:hypothetical protein
MNEAISLTPHCICIGRLHPFLWSAGSCAERLTASGIMGIGRRMDKGTFLHLALMQFLKNVDSIIWEQLVGYDCISSISNLLSFTPILETNLKYKCNLRT